MDYKKKLEWCFYAFLSGLLSGLAASIFLITLDQITAFRFEHPEWVYGLPLGGLLIGLVDHYYGRSIAPGTSLILDEIHDPKKVTPLRMAPFLYFYTLTTHLFGGSAGREGAAVQMGASLSDQLSKVFPIDHQERKILLVAGAGAGFAAALGAPFAGIFFGMELIHTGKIKPFAIVECTIASLVAITVSHLMGAPHVHFPHFEVPYTFHALLWTALVSVLFAILVRLFFSSTHLVESNFKKWIQYPPLKPLVGGVLLVLFFKGFHLELFEGLGIETILRSFQEPMPASFPFLKIALTALTLGVGFKGGEFVPLLFIGATAGACLSGFSHLDTPLLAALGCVALFGAASKTPFSCSILAMELFGWKIAPFAFLACYLSTYFSGRKTIYARART